MKFKGKNNSYVGDWPASWDEGRLVTALSTFGSCVISVCDSPEPLHAPNTAWKGVPLWVVTDTPMNNAATASILAVTIFTLLFNLVKVYRYVQYLNCPADLFNLDEGYRQLIIGIDRIIQPIWIHLVLNQIFLNSTKDKGKVTYTVMNTCERCTSTWDAYCANAWITSASGLEFSRNTSQPL